MTTKTFKQGDKVRIVDIHKEDAFFRYRSDLNNISIKLDSEVRIGYGDPEGYVYYRCYLKFLTTIHAGANNGGRRVFDKDDSICFAGVALEKL